jgi:hypothetical protein
MPSKHPVKNGVRGNACRGKIDSVTVASGNRIQHDLLETVLSCLSAFILSARTGWDT